MNRDPYKYFRLEARELLAQFNVALLELEKNGNDGAQVKRLLRLAHTLKGAARVVKLTDIAQRAHAIEDVLSPYRDGGGEIPQHSVDAVLGHVGAIAGLIPGEALASASVVGSAPVGAPASVVSAPERPAATEGDERVRTIRADVSEMDALLEGVVTAHAVLNRMRTARPRLDRAQHLAALLIAQLSSDPGQDTRDMTRAPVMRARSTAEELRKLLAGIRDSTDLAVDQMNRELGQLRDAAEQLRLVPADVIFAPLERLARDVARGMAKQVTFEGSGTAIHLDGYVLDGTRSALVQIVRNAVAHGIESPEERRAAGKTATGHISLSVVRREKHVVFRCTDDGRGIDLEAVRGVASRRGLLQPGVRASNAEDLIALLLKGGLSTAETVTDAAGRGIGLDVVREAIGRLGGTTVVHTTAGKGTTFELAVPISITSVHALAVETGAETVTIPLDAVSTALRVPSENISWTPQGASISHDGSAIPFISLGRALFGTRTPGRAAWTVLILRNGDHLAAVGVDRLIGATRPAVRPLAATVPVGKIVAGTTLDAEGNPQLVLDPAALVAIAHQGREDIEEAPAPKPILVIDDSLTTRMLEQSILESAGYDVDVATSGEEGFDCAQRKSYALILVDVEMPGMDGFTFVERIRGDRALHDTPVILVTSRASPEDFQRGKDVRADGYVVKGEFDQTKLLNMIKPLAARG